MCGICGVYYVDRERQVDPQLVERMNYVQRHRGPDGYGVWSQNNVGLGQSRLAIIDLSPQGLQPMSNEDGSVWMTFNGEIYNFPELRQGLLARGHHFRSHTDSETIIHLWEEKGPQMLDDLRGMFAIALWDERQQTLFLARDRMGKKPLFYADLPGRIVFASEIKAILQDPDFIPEPDLEAIKYYLAYQSVPAPYCAFKGIKKLPPAHYLLAKHGHVQVKRYWQLSYQDPLRVESEAAEKDLQAEIIERLREVVRMRLISDVPLGAFLSGGVDSSIVVALMAELMNQPVKTFSIGFPQDEYNELPYARQVAERYHTDHHEFVVTPDAQAIIPHLVWHYNEPFADSSAIPTYYVSQLARQFVTVALTGDAGDENFAGYPRYLFEEPFGPEYPRIQQRLIDPTIDERLRPFVHPGRLTLADRRRMIDLKKARLYYYYRITHFQEAHLQELLSPDFAARTADIFPVDIMLQKYRQSGARDFLDSTLFVDLNFYLPDTLMTKTDIAGMAHSLEARMPMLDHKFLEFAARIPSRLKLRDGVGKSILKKAVEPYLPHEVIYRNKMGFAVPIDHWFRGELKEMLYDTLLSPRALQRGYFQPQYVRWLLDSHQRGERLHFWIWNLLMLELWQQMFIDRTLTPPNLEDYSAAFRGVSERVRG
jgi:asparagine synthase (glutamine-hydrolysing)